MEDVRKAHVASIDLDSLKYFNDAFGHQTGDEMLINFANALKQITDADTYHISGDEFIVQADDEAKLDEILHKRIVSHLGKNPITVTLPDGKQIKYEVRFSYGKAETLTKAEEALGKHKTAREAEGSRAGRGEIPAGLPGGPAKGQRPGGERKEIPENELEPGETGEIPPDTDGLTENADRSGLPEGTLEGRNDWRRTGYGGPCPPGGTHRYFFKLYALDTVLNLDSGITKDKLEKAMKGHILAEGQLMGRYKR